MGELLYSMTKNSNMGLEASGFMYWFIHVKDPVCLCSTSSGSVGVFTMKHSYMYLDSILFMTSARASGGKEINEKNHFPHLHFTVLYSETCLIMEEEKKKKNPECFHRFFMPHFA